MAKLTPLPEAADYLAAGACTACLFPTSACVQIASVQASRIACRLGPLKLDLNSPIYCSLCWKLQSFVHMCSVWHEGRSYAV